MTFRLWRCFLPGGQSFYSGQCTRIQVHRALVKRFLRLIEIRREKDKMKEETTLKQKRKSPDELDIVFVCNSSCAVVPGEKFKHLLLADDKHLVNMLEPFFV